MISIIAAIAENYAIGKDNKLLWQLPNDLKHFKKITEGHTIIMGRKTFESLPKVLPNRKHFVLTRNNEFNMDDDNVTVFYYIEDLINNLKDNEEYFVIGGGKIYKQFLHYAKKMYLTVVYGEYEADTFFPAIDLKRWSITQLSQGIIDEKNTIPHLFITLEIKN